MTSLPGRAFEVQPASEGAEQVKEGQPDMRGDITVAQRFFDPKDRYQSSEDSEDVKVEKAVEEYLVDKVYGCQVIVTNCSIATLEFSIMSEIPDGAIPVRTIEYTKSLAKVIQSYTTSTFEFFFYFPAVGKFAVYPANASRDEKVLAVAQLQ